MFSFFFIISKTNKFNKHLLKRYYLQKRKIWIISSISNKAKEAMKQY